MSGYTAYIYESDDSDDGFDRVSHRDLTTLYLYILRTRQGTLTPDLASGGVRYRGRDSDGRRIVIHQDGQPWT